MEVASGHVSDKPFARLVYTMAARRFTGDLILKQNNKEYRLSWEDGVMVAAASPELTDQPGRLALQSGLVDSTTLADAMKLAQLQKSDVLEVIGELAQLKPEQVLKVRRQALGMRAIRIFALANATYVLDNARSMKPDPSIAPIDIRWLVYHGLRTHYTLPRLEADLQAMANAAVMLDESALPAIAYFGFGYSEQPLLEELRKRPLTLADLAATAVNMDRQAVLSFIYALVACDCLKLHDAAQAAARPPAPSAPAAEPIQLRRDGGPPRMTAPPPMTQPPPATRPSPMTTAPPNEPVRPSAIAAAATPEPGTPNRIKASGKSEGVSSRSWRATQEQPGKAPEGSGRHAVPVPHPNDTTGPTRQMSVRDAAAPRPAPDKDKTAKVKKPKVTADQVRALIAGKREAIHRNVTHFELLDTHEKATTDQIRASYFRLARNLHPDRLQALGIDDMVDEAQEVFSCINEAFAVLGNATRLADYRKELASGLTGKNQEDAEQLAAKLFAAEEHFLKGQMSLRRNAFAEALREFKQAYELNPEEPEHIALLAWTTWCSTPNKQEVSSEVEKLFEAAVKMSPKCAPAWLYSAKVAAQQGKSDSAVKRLQKVLELDPNNHEATAELRVLKTRQQKR